MVIFTQTQAAPKLIGRSATYSAGVAARAPARCHPATPLPGRLLTVRRPVALVPRQAPRGDWTITYAGNRNGLGRWANTASGVAIPGAVGGAAALTAVNQTGDTANAQVRGLSFVNEFKMIYNP